MYKFIRVLLAISLLALLAWFVDLEAAIVLLEKTDWRWLLVALIVVQIQIVLSALRWKITAIRLGQSLSGIRAISEYYLATFTNLSVPGGVIGDAARVYRNRVPDGPGISIYSVVLERLSGQIALLLIALAGWLLWPLLMPGQMPQRAVRLINLALGAFIVIAVLCQLLLRYAPDRFTDWFIGFRKAAHRVWVSDRQWLVQGVLSLGIVMTYLIVFYCCTCAINAPLPLPAVLTLVPLVLLSMLIPITIGGWGIREAAAAVLWPLVALEPEAGVVSSAVYAIISWLGCLPGLLLVLVARSHSRRS